MSFIEKEGTFTIKIDSDRMKKFNRVVDNLGIDSEEYNKTEIFEKVFEAAESKSKPKGSLPEDLERIKELESLKESVQSENLAFKGANDVFENVINDLKIEKEHYEMRLTAADEAKQKLQSDNDDLRTALTESESLRNEENTNAHYQIVEAAKIPENVVVISLTEVQKAYLSDLIKLPRVHKFFKDENKDGKLTPIIPVLSDTSKESIGKMLIGWFFYSAKIERFPLTDFNKWYKIQKDGSK